MNLDQKIKDKVNQKIKVSKMLKYEKDEILLQDQGKTGKTGDNEVDQVIRRERTSINQDLLRHLKDIKEKGDILLNLIENK